VPSPSPRDRSREAIYDALVERPGLTRAEIGHVVDLPPSTVRQAVARLLGDGRVEESEHEFKGRGSGSGRPATRLVIADVGAVVGGIDFGHAHVHVALARTAGDVIADRRVVIHEDSPASAFISCAADLLETLMREHGIDGVIGVAAGVPGPVDRNAETMDSPTTLPGWRGVAPRRELQERLHVPVWVENDAAMGALGELDDGAGRDHPCYIYVKASHGVGAGLVLERRLYGGLDGTAGEIGHTVVPGHHELCRCGNRGCLETFVSVSALRRQLNLTHPSLTFESIADLPDDPVIDRLMTEAGYELGVSIASFCNLLNPSAIILGGDLGSSGTAFIDGVRMSVRRHAQAATAASIQIVPAALGARSGLIGAVRVASVQALKNDRRVPDRMAQ